MKKRILTISIILTVIFLIIATVFFFLTKNAGENNSENQVEEYNASESVEKLEFLKLNSFNEVKKYADESPIHILNSDDKNLFGIGELYIEDFPVTLFYSLNDDGTISRIDGTCFITKDNLSEEYVGGALHRVNRIVSGFFNIENVFFTAYDENGAEMENYTVQTYEQLINGKARYRLTVIDESNTYWSILIKVTDKKQIEIEFFRCFDLSVYSDDSPNLDLRSQENTEVE